ncbi:MAG: FAD-binding protein [Myxococcaceae bacterium]|nr:MAG: FAD-binding protein [Myxococcaceae bacterium]
MSEVKLVTHSHSAPDVYDLAIVGCGAAALAAACAALESSPDLSVVLLERTSEAERGGNTKWSSSFFRTADDKAPADGFEEDFEDFTQGMADAEYVRRLRENTQETLRWVESKGVSFEMVPMFFLTGSKPRLGISGGGASIVDKLSSHAESLGAEIRYQHTATELLTEGEGSAVRVVGVRCETPQGAVEVPARTVLLGSGGYQGNAELMLESFGHHAEFLKPVARGGGYNRGEGIAMALAAGAAKAGEWPNFHGEPVDPRSTLCEPVVMTFPYGILVNSDAKRFVNEGLSTVDEIYEDTCRAIFAQPGNLSYLIADHRLLELDGFERATLTDRAAYTAPTLEELAKRLDLDPEALVATIEEYNRAERPEGVEFDATKADGLSASGITPAKSNWARTIDEPPFVAYPVSTAICFTYGGVAVDTDGRVIREDGSWVQGLWAAGEMTGLYYDKYPGATSVLRSLVFGRIAADDAVDHLGRAEG